MDPRHNDFWEFLPVWTNCWRIAIDEKKRATWCLA